MAATEVKAQYLNWLCGILVEVLDNFISHPVAVATLFPSLYGPKSQLTFALFYKSFMNSYVVKHIFICLLQIYCDVQQFIHSTNWEFIQKRLCH